MSDTNMYGVGKILAANNSFLVGTQKAGDASKPDFSAVISQTGANQTQATTTQKNDLMDHRQTAKDDTVKSASEDYEKYQYKDKQIQSTDDTKTSQTTEAVEEKINAFEENVKDVLQEELGVTEEQITSAMETLGLSYIDLLDQNQLANLVAKLTGTENVSGLLCNEQFVNILQDVNALGTDLLQDLQMTKPELETFLTAMNENETVPDTETIVQPTESNAVTPEQQEVITNAADKNLTEKLPENGAEAKTDVTTETVVAVAETNADGEEDASSMNQQSNEQQMMEEDNSTPKTELVTESRQKGKNTFDGVLNQETPQTAAINQNTVTDNLSTVETVTTLPEHVNIKDIMDQIMDTARVTLSQDMSKMEMQLNPENLGKIVVELTEKDGVVSAKLETQNLLVKEALETQIADLRQNLNQAGVKVDAVEVTVASHEFERNLEQGAEGEKQQAQEQEKAAKQRRINIGDLDELSGIMSEEEALVAKMMSEQGNSIDYTA